MRRGLQNVKIKEGNGMFSIDISKMESGLHLMDECRQQLNREIYKLKNIEYEIRFTKMKLSDEQLYLKTLESIEKELGEEKNKLDLMYNALARIIDTYIKTEDNIVNQAEPAPKIHSSVVRQNLEYLTDILFNI